MGNHTVSGLSQLTGGDGWSFRTFASQSLNMSIIKNQVYKLRSKLRLKRSDRYSKFITQFILLLSLLLRLFASTVSARPKSYITVMVTVRHCFPTLNLVMSCW